MRASLILALVAGFAAAAAAQTPPLWQTWPAQHAMFSAPHIMQMFGPVAGFAQPRPVLQVPVATVPEPQQA